MDNIMTASLNETPLSIISGQQTRKMLLCEPMLSCCRTVILPYCLRNTSNVPGALLSAIAIATQAASGPVYLSILLDDWDETIAEVPRVTSPSTR
jgi:benzoylformate decarboxylase